MRTIIAGSRSVTDIEHLWQALRLWKYPITVVLSGKARGADTLGEEWARLCSIPIEAYPTDWNTYPRTAGFVRNQQMADNAQALIALWNGRSGGTKDMIKRAHKNNLIVLVHQIKD